MDDERIRERLAGYRASRDEWARRRAAAMAQAEDCAARMAACSGAIEALEDLLPTPTLEEVVASVDG